MMTLYSGPLSMFGAKAQIAALEKGLDHTVEMVPFTLKDLYSPKHPEVARINPKAQVPVLRHDGLEIFDSTQIFEYFEEICPDPALWPASPAAKAQARLWELKSDEVFFPHVITIMGHIMDQQHPDFIAAQAAIGDYYTMLNAHLAGRETIAEGYSFADIAFYMAQFFASFLFTAPGPELEALHAWRKHVGSRSAVKEVIEPMQKALAANGLVVPDAA